MNANPESPVCSDCNASLHHRTEKAELSKLCVTAKSREYEDNVKSIMNLMERQKVLQTQLKLEIPTTDARNAGKRRR